MTNTHINVGGHKITTNKVGQVHSVSPASGFTGSFSWCVTNGICVVTGVQIKANASTGAQTACAGLPKAKIGAYTTSNVSTALWYIEANKTVLLSYPVNTTSNHYFQIIYPVADDWVES